MRRILMNSNSPVAVAVRLVMVLQEVAELASMEVETLEQSEQLLARIGAVAYAALEREVLGVDDVPLQAELEDAEWPAGDYRWLIGRAP
jgi:hypothetical protein